MNYKLFEDMFYAAPEFWLFLLFVICAIVSILYSKILKLRRKNYFLNRDRERYAETLYALRDGYFAFIYPDKRINDYRRGVKERCSRRLAVMLNLKNGRESQFSDVLEQFYKEDARKIQKYLALLRDEGVAFEDVFALKGSNSYITLAGSRINGYDGNVYCDVMWFRDVSSETQKIISLEEEKDLYNKKIMQFERLINNIPYPIFLRNENLNIILTNKKYTELAAAKGRAENADLEAEFASVNTAMLAQSSNKPQKQTINMTVDGESKYFDLIETPAYEEENLGRICTVGAMIDVSELDELKRNLKMHQNAHLQVLSMLGTAFGVFDKDAKLSFYNEAFAQMWKLDAVFLETKPSYQTFLDSLKERRLLPEVPDFKGYKKEELDNFNKLIETKEDLMHLPDGRTIRRVRSPNPSGGLIFAFEDVSDRLAVRRAYNLLLETQKGILESFTDAALIFGSNGRLKYYNNAYVELWAADKTMLGQEPSLVEVIDMQKKFFASVGDWEKTRRFIAEKIAAGSYQSVRNDGIELTAKTETLPDDSFLIIYKKK